MLQSLKLFTAHAVKNLNIETEKSEQTLFAQIFLSQYYDSSTACTTKHFKDHNPGHEELLTYIGVVGWCDGAGQTSSAGAFSVHFGL